MCSVNSECGFSLPLRCGCRPRPRPTRSWGGGEKSRATSSCRCRDREYGTAGNVTGIRNQSFGTKKFHQFLGKKTLPRGFGLVIIVSGPRRSSVIRSNAMGRIPGRRRSCQLSSVLRPRPCLSALPGLDTPLVPGKRSQNFPRPPPKITDQLEKELQSTTTRASHLSGATRAASRARHNAPHASRAGAERRDPLPAGVIVSPHQAREDDGRQNRLLWSPRGHRAGLHHLLAMASLEFANFCRALLFESW